MQHRQRVHIILHAKHRGAVQIVDVRTCRHMPTFRLQTKNCCSLVLQPCILHAPSPTHWQKSTISVVCASRKPCPATHGMSPLIHRHNSASGVRYVRNHTWFWVPPLWESTRCHTPVRMCCYVACDTVNHNPEPSTMALHCVTQSKHNNALCKPSNSIAFGSAPRREVDSQPISP